MTASTPAGTNHESASSPLVSVEAVSVTLGEIQAVTDVSLELEPGRLLGLIGPNGAGKTTLLRTITAAISPDTGTVRVGGEDVHALSSKAVSRKIAVVPQDASLAFDFDVRDLVSMGRTPYLHRFSPSRPADRASVEAAMRRTDVAQFAERALSEVSGGERQRVLLARAIAQDTPVLLLDEPTASLDINHQIRTLELVRELVADGKTVIAAIHDLNLAARYCDDLLLLRDGRVTARGPPAQVLATDHIDEAFGARSVITTHPVTGTAHITALPGPCEESVEPCVVHIVPGPRTDVTLLYTLWQAGVTISIGPLPRGHSLEMTTAPLDIEAITTEPFRPLEGSVLDAVGERIAAADAVVGDAETIGSYRRLLDGRGGTRLIVLADDETEAPAVGGVEPAILCSAGACLSHLRSVANSNPPSE